MKETYKEALAKLTDLAETWEQKEDEFSDIVQEDIAGLKEALEKELNTFSFVKEFEIAANRYGANIGDKELDTKDGRWERKTKLYADLRNIAAQVIGIGSINWKDFCETEKNA